MNSKQLLLILSIILCSFQSSKAQKKQFLQRVGVLDSVYSNTLKEQRELYIQFPLNYDQNKKYPVVYILDGEILLPTVHNVQDFYSGGFTPEMILVGVSNAKNRTRDLTTSKITEKYGMPFQAENGAAANFSTFIESELIPFIENKYPVTNFRTLIGHSYGGLFTIYTLINHPQLFSNYIAIDPSLDWDNQKIIKQAQSKLASANYEGKSLFMSLGGQLHMQNAAITIDNVMEDSSSFTLFARSNIEFSNLVKQNNKNGLSFKWKFYPNDLHGTIPFPSIKEGLLFNFEWYQMEHMSKFNLPTTPKQDLATIVNYRAEKLKKHFGYTVPAYPEELLNGLGYMSMDMDQMEKAKMFFEFAIKFYPNSANTYDSMADYYVKKADYANAIKYLTTAYEISGNNRYKKRIEELQKE